MFLCGLWWGSFGPEASGPQAMDAVVQRTYARRAGLGARVMLIGVCGAPVVLGTVLVVLPAILRAVGLLSAP